MAMQIGQIIDDKYRVMREIGSGSMGAVYEGENLKIHRRVAIKVLRPQLSASLGVERFVREIEIAANLTHPHILPLFDSGQADGFLYYVMPFIEGESLRDRLTREKKLAVPDAVRITDQVASALGHAHERGLVHRDIKPENIVVDETGGADRHQARFVVQAGVSYSIRVSDTDGGTGRFHFRLRTDNPVIETPRQGTAGWINGLRARGPASSSSASSASSSLAAT